MSTSTELRRIVGAMTELEVTFPDPRACELAERLVAPGPKACAVSASETHEISEAVLAVFEPDSPIATLANHADAFVALVEACERFDEVMKGGYDGATIAGSSRAVRSALAAVHAIKETK